MTGMLPRLDKISQDQIQEVLDKHFTETPLTLRYDIRGYLRSEELVPNTPDDKEKFLNNLYNHLFLAATDASSHALRIDDLLSSLIWCSFNYDKPTGEIVSNTQLILRRMPLYVIPLPGRYPELLDLAYSQLEQFDGGIWENLIISNTSSLNVVRMAIHISIDSANVPLVKDFLTLLGELLSLSSQRTPGSQNYNGRTKDANFIVRAALWTSWQRLTMLYYYAFVGLEIFLGRRTFADDSRLLLHDFQADVACSIRDVSNMYASQEKSNYMCSWALELLRSQPCSIGMDFRRFHDRFNLAWDQEPGRCIRQHSYSCTGQRYTDCRRFVGLKVENQSAHDERCNGLCRKLVWNGASYRAIQGSRAVSVSQTNFKSGIQYCAVSNRTLAISHVWSHGQGGRPEEGVNECLHNRYTKIAAEHQCDSYWWDIACIPEDHRLRREAINGINRTFSRSKMVLACDRDIMKLDISDDTVQSKEVLLATVLVCDWNVRAWTYLESMRGRNQLYLLCKRNVCVNFNDLVQEIWREGCIDIAILSLTARHMLPWSTSPLTASHTENMDLEVAGNVLNHRPASRKGDDFVIWSLLIGLDNDSTAELPFKDTSQNSEEFRLRFWQTFVGMNISTGFLVSSAPRLSSQNFSWAPSTASCSPGGDDWLKHANFGGRNSGEARITTQGIIGEWLIYEFDANELLETKVNTFTPHINRRLKEICQAHLKTYSKGALIHPVTDEMRALIDPITGDIDYSRGIVEYQGYQGRHGGTMFAILGMTLHHEQTLGWKWKGIWQWSSAVDFPQLKLVHDILIS